MITIFNGQIPSTPATIRTIDVDFEVDAKESRSFRAIIVDSNLNSGPMWTPHAYANYAKEGYCQNPDVFACINMISRSVKGIEWQIYQKTSKDKIETHPWKDLLNRPNPRQGMASFFEQTTAFLMIAGNNYMEKVGPETLEQRSLSQPPRELYNLRPDCMTIVKGTPVEPIKGFDFKFAGRVVPYRNQTYKGDIMSPICHTKLFNPLDDFYGLSPISAAAKNVDQGNSAQNWNVSLTQNMGRPSGVLISEEELSDEQYERAKAELRQYHMGPANAGKPLVLAGGKFKWQSMSINPVDMDWLEGLERTTTKIASTFGVAPELVGDARNRTYSNFSEARRSLYTEVVLPLLDQIKSDMNNWLGPFWPDVYMDYDRDSIEALQDDKESLRKQMAEMVKSGIYTPNEARKELGLKPYTDNPNAQFGDKLFVARGAHPIDEPQTTETITDQISGDPANPDKKPAPVALPTPQPRKRRRD